MAVASVSPAELAALSNQTRSVDLIDVRSPVEFAEVHAKGARSVPLDSLNPKSVIANRNGPIDEPFYFICKSGQRARKAIERFSAEGIHNVVNVEGGMIAWLDAGLPVVRGTRTVISLERQVRIAAGLLVLFGVALGVLVHPVFLGVSAVVGAGLIFAGVTDWCGMGMLLARMPWNKVTRSDGGPACSRKSLL